MADAMRVDKWLWAARFFKTRAVAQTQIGLGRVLLAGQRLKASREVHVGDRLEIQRGDEVFHIYVEGLSPVRGPASAARLLYRETPESIAERERRATLRKLASEPSVTIEQGRPTKRDGRRLRRLKHEAWLED